MRILNRDRMIRSSFRKMEVLCLNTGCAMNKKCLSNFMMTQMYNP